MFYKVKTINQQILDKAVRLATKYALDGKPVESLTWIPPTSATEDPDGSFIVVFRRPSSATDN